MNILVLVIICKNKPIRQHIASVFIANLAAIDLMNLLFVMPFSVQTVIHGRWVHSETLCEVNGLFGTLFSLASILTLAVISLDRWAAVMKPLVYKARMTVSYAVQMTLYVWFQAMIFSIAPLFKTWYVTNMRYSSCGFPSGPVNDSFLTYMCLTIVLNIGLSLVIILVTYFYVFRIARSHSRRIAVALVSVFAREHRRLRKETVRQREARTAIKISFVIGAFLICHLPYSVVRTLELIGKTSSVFSLSPAFLVSIKWIVYLKSAVNPFVYSLLQKRFRGALMELFIRSKRENERNYNTTRNPVMRDSQSVHAPLPTITTGTTLTSPVTDSLAGNAVLPESSIKTVCPTDNSTEMFWNKFLHLQFATLNFGKSNFPIPVMCPIVGAIYFVGHWFGSVVYK